MCLTVMATIEIFVDEVNANMCSKQITQLQSGHIFEEINSLSFP